MQKFFVFILSVFVIFLYNCSEPEKKEVSVKTPELDRDLEQIFEIDTLKVLINYGPTSYFVYKGTPMGFEYELLKTYANNIGIRLNLIPIKNLDSLFIHLDNGTGDLISANMTITEERVRNYLFTEPILVTKQVLVQRKPEGWKKLSRKELQDSLIKSPDELVDKTITVRKNSSFYSHLKDISTEIKGLNIHTVSGETSLEHLIQRLVKGEIEYTVADKNIASVLQWSYPSIDANTVIGTNQRIAWVLRDNSDSLSTSINQWLETFQRTKKFKQLYYKYFKNRSGYNSRVKDKYYTLKSGVISPYDELLKKHVTKIHWDWELLASLIYQESRFNNKVRGWGGAFGLMQFMPETGASYGIDSTSSVEDNIIAGTKYIRRLNNIWKPHVQDSLERIKFILASYNVGPGHVLDAFRLTKKNGKNPLNWRDVSYYLLHKSDPRYYRDEVVKHGYCKGHITYKYVNEIIDRYEHYKKMVNSGL